MNLRTDEYTKIVNLLETAKARDNANRRARNLARTQLRTHLLVGMTAGNNQNPAATLELMNNRIRDLEMATEAQAQTSLAVNLISNFLAVKAWEKVLQSPCSMPSPGPAS